MSIVTTTIWIVTITITVVTVTSEIVTPTILVCWGYNNKTVCWDNKIIFSVCLTVQCVNLFLWIDAKECLSIHHRWLSQFWLLNKKGAPKLNVLLYIWFPNNKSVSIQSRHFQQLASIACWYLRWHFCLLLLVSVYLQGKANQCGASRKRFIISVSDLTMLSAEYFLRQPFSPHA